MIETKIRALVSLICHYQRGALSSGNVILSVDELENLKKCIISLKNN